MNDQPPAPGNERLLTLLALAAQEPRPLNDCPTDVTLVLFMEGKLDGQARQTVLSHLNRCQTCYHLWLEAATALDANTLPMAAPSQPKLSLWQRWQPWFTWKLAVPAFAIAALVGLLVLQPVPPDLNQEISASYASLKAQAPRELATNVATLTLPGSTATFGFSAAAIPPATRAFGAGVWEGKQAFSPDKAALPEGLSPPPEKSWQATEWSDYYAFGRWAVLMWAFASDEYFASDWPKQQKILTDLLERFSKHPANEEKVDLASNTLKKIQPLLAVAPSNEQARHDLQRQLNMAIQQLAP